MKRVSFYYTAIVTAIFAFTSCDNDYVDSNGYGITYDVWQSYGTFDGPNGDGKAVITRDDGAELIVTDSRAHNFFPTVGQRVIINYSIYREVSTENVFQKIYQIGINDGDEIQTEGIIKQSFINTDSTKIEDSLGHDPILNISKAWISGDYLNINLRYPRNYHTNSQVTHTLSMVYDDISLDSLGNVVLTLRHNAHGDTAPGNKDMEYDFARTAYNISSILPEGQASAKIILKWITYDDKLQNIVTKSSTAVFTRPQVNTAKTTNSDGAHILVDGPEFGLNEVATKVE